MRLGPGKHLKGRKLMGGLVTPEEFDYFHEVYPSIICQSSKLTYINCWAFSSSSTVKFPALALAASSMACLQVVALVCLQCSILVRLK